MVIAANGELATWGGIVDLEARQLGRSEATDQLSEWTGGHFIDDDDIFVLFGSGIQEGFDGECVRQSLRKR